MIQSVECYLDELRQHGLKHRVLVVDDEFENLVVVESVLSGEHDVVTSSSGEEALEILRKGGVDLVITDQRMPGMSGVELLREAKRVSPGTMRIVLSAWSDADAMLSAINQGEVYRFLLKPWEPPALRATVREALEKRTYERAVQSLIEKLTLKNEELERSCQALETAQGKLLHTTRLATVGQLTAGICHELRNQLTGLTLIVDTVSDMPKDPDLENCIQFGLEALHTVHAMVEDINRYARKGEWNIALDAMDLNATVQRAAAFTRFDPLLKRRTVQDDLGRLPDVPHDRGKIRQVIVNLLRNAAQATSEGGNIRITTRASAGDALLSVSDDGCGIPPDRLATLFEAFSSTRGESGLGLGLEISKSIVEQHGGRIEVESRVGEGSTFTVILPTAG